MLKIDTNIPIPSAKKAEETDVIKSTLESMAPGDSFVTPPGIQINQIRRAAEQLKIRIKIGKDEYGKRRCWRVGEMKNNELFESYKPELKRRFADAGIVQCELNYPKCSGTFGLGFAHSKRRRLIKNDQELREVIRACNSCHDILDAKPHAETRMIVKAIIRNRKRAI